MGLCLKAFSYAERACSKLPICSATRPGGKNDPKATQVSEVGVKAKTNSYLSTARFVRWPVPAFELMKVQRLHLSLRGTRPLGRLIARDQNRWHQASKDDYYHSDGADEGEHGMVVLAESDHGEHEDREGGCRDRLGGECA